MARGKKSQRGRGRGRGGGRNRDTQPDDNRTDAIQKSDMQNERFEAYYKIQNIIPDDEWESFMEKMKEPLPTTFRLAGSRDTAEELNGIIKNNYVPNLANIVFEGEKVPSPTQIPWYPGGLAWQFNIPKKVLRKSPEFKKFHSFIVFETEVGNISRQEAVSMIPPLFLDVEPHHKVLDLCAAPGSKTAQLVEALHASDTATSTSVPPGLVIANDSDHKRTHLLIHQSARLPSPAFLVTNLDASIYPRMKIASESGTKGKEERLLFDRILCDVPCSGDGTLRKNLAIWKRWQPGDGNGLHSLQLRILQRAMKLLAEGGRIVYSTCSLNPVENEAIVAAALNTNPDFHLVSVSERFPDLHRRPGVTSWKPTADKTVKESSFYDSYDNYAQAMEGNTTNSKLSESHWPPDNVTELGLEKCMRIYPHQQDTGAFFIAVLERKHQPLTRAQEKKRQASPSGVNEPETKKVRVDGNVADVAAEVTITPTAATLATIPVEDDLTMNVDPATTAPNADDQDESTINGTFKENPYTYISPDDPILRVCIERLRLLPNFPSSHVLVRNPTGTASRALYLTNALARAVITANDYTRIRLTSAGTKVFVKQEASAKEKSAASEESGNSDVGQWRILGEGLPLALPFIEQDWLMEAGVKELRELCKTYYPLFSVFEDPFKTEVENRQLGCQIVRFKLSDSGDITLSRDIILPIWKNKSSLTLMIDKKAKSALSLRVFGEDITTAGRENSQVKKAASTEVVEGENEASTPDVDKEVKDGILEDAE